MPGDVRVRDARPGGCQIVGYAASPRTRRIRSSTTASGCRVPDRGWSARFGLGCIEQVVKVLGDRSRIRAAQERDRRVRTMRREVDVARRARRVTYSSIACGRRPARPTSRGASRAGPRSRRVPDGGSSHGASRRYRTVSRTSIDVRVTVRHLPPFDHHLAVERPDRHSCSEREPVVVPEWPSATSRTPDIPSIWHVGEWFIGCGPEAAEAPVHAGRRARRRPCRPPSRGRRERRTPGLRIRERRNAPRTCYPSPDERALGRCRPPVDKYFEFDGEGLSDTIRKTPGGP